MRWGYWGVDESSELEKCDISAIFVSVLSGPRLGKRTEKPRSGTPMLPFLSLPNSWNAVWQSVCSAGGGFHLRHGGMHSLNSPLVVRSSGRGLRVAVCILAKKRQ
jgi:hypothetical protein